MVSGKVVIGDLCGICRGVAHTDRTTGFVIDDRASLHKAGFDYDHSQHRRLYRMLVRGDRPF